MSIEALKSGDFLAPQVIKASEFDYVGVPQVNSEKSKLDFGLVFEIRVESATFAR